MNATISLDNILLMLSSLSKGNKKWLADHLIEQVAEEESMDSLEKEREKRLNYFLKKFRTDEISEEEIWEECEAVRQERYEERLQAR